MSGEKLASMKDQIYRDPRPKEYFDRFHERSRTRDPDWVYEVVRMATTMYALSFFRTRCISSEKVPASGPLIIAPNHFSFMDHFFVGAFTRRKVRFMAKSQMFKPPLQFIYTHGGVFPVRRGARDDEAFATAHSVLERDGAIVMYCEGGRSRTGALAEQAKPGIGRLALESGATVLPVAIHGSAKVRNWKRGQFPKVIVQYGDPFRFERVETPTRHQSQVAADEIFGEIKTLYNGLTEFGESRVRASVRAARRAARQAGKRAAPAS